MTTPAPNDDLVPLERRCAIKAEVLLSRGKMNTLHDIAQAADYLNEATTALKARAERISVLERALEVAKRTIIEGGSGGVTCTVWVPYDVSPNETLVDHIDAALAREGAR